MQPGKTPRAFAELLFGHINIEDLVNYDAASLAFLAEQAWEHVQQRTAGSADIRVINPMMPDGREISVLEVLNDNMPFLFDSTMAELAEQGIEVTLVAHPIIAVERDEQGKLLRFYGETLTEGAKGERESLIHFHIARLDADADRQKLIDGLTKTLNDVRACVADWQAMRARVEQAIKTFNTNPPPLPIDEVAEASQFLQWLCADNFTFLGLREYRFSSDTDGSDEISDGPRPRHPARSRCEDPAPRHRNGGDDAGNPRIHARADCPHRHQGQCEQPCSSPRPHGLCRHQALYARRPA